MSMVVVVMPIDNHNDDDDDGGDDDDDSNTHQHLDSQSHRLKSVSYQCVIWRTVLAAK